MNKKELLEALKSYASKLSEGELEQLYGDGEDFGHYVSESDLPNLETYQDEGDPGWFRKIVDEKRLKELEDGALPTEAEMKSYQEDWMDRLFWGDGDADSIPGYALSKITTDEGLEGVALILCRGYSYSGTTTSLAGVFVSMEEAQRAISSRCF